MSSSSEKPNAALRSWHAQELVETPFLTSSKTTLQKLSEPLISSGAKDAPEADMARRCIDGLRVTCRGAVAAAIIRRAEMRAAFEDLARNPDRRLAGIVTRFLFGAARIDGDTTRFRRIGLVL